MIMGPVKRKAGIACSGCALERTLRRMHFSCRKVNRPVPRNSASGEAQEASMGEAGARIAELRARGSAVFAGGGWSARMWTGNGYAWRPAGGRDTARTRFSNGSAKAFCALGGGTVHTVPADRAILTGFSGSQRRFTGGVENLPRSWTTRTICGQCVGQRRRHAPASDDDGPPPPRHDETEIRGVGWRGASGQAVRVLELNLVATSSFLCQIGLLVHKITFSSINDMSA